MANNNIKILHFSDLHIGVESYGSTDPETGLSTRLQDILNVFDQVVDYALEEQVNLVIFTGDAYKSRDPSQTQQREFAKRIKRLSLAGIPTFLLVGNHDLPNAIGRATTLEIFHTLAVNNIHVGNRPAIHVIETSSGPVQIAALPWPRRNALLSKIENKGLSIEESTEKLQQILTETIASLARSADPHIPTILAAHASVANAKVGSERSMLLGQDPVLLTSNLTILPFDYIALGHIHKAQILGECPPVAYSGSLERIDFNEEKDEKGFYILDINNSQEPGARCTAFHFQPVSARKFITIEVDIESGTSNPMDLVINAIAKYEHQIKDAIIRVIVHMPDQLEGQLQENDIRKALKAAHYLNITKDIKRESRIRLGGRPAEELTPLQALDLYLDSKKTLQERKKTLLEYAQTIIWEREPQEE